jgi:hypothetical protein
MRYKVMMRYYHKYGHPVERAVDFLGYKDGALPIGQAIEQMRIDRQGDYQHGRWPAEYWLVPVDAQEAA